MNRSRPSRTAPRIKPCLVVYDNPEGGLIVMVDARALPTPAIWGIAVADIVQHITNAHVTTGMAYKAVRDDIIHFLLAELHQPSPRADSVDPDGQEEWQTVVTRAKARAEAGTEGENEQ